ncbi:Uncharacterized NAD(P)/FAD-binding protein YdhS [Nocardioides scoriae]|uniref:Uncharacterized NAD(P)/FAD-binding protein YdhS n=1 Tax=Nocardioides scoriae TaxID=642780 RepID=A0A1H1Y432_9ACTN|nr:FAD/NAD(P)-binding protein [Nocardioides scoriae]SDT16152.1 Uncharacterized NAD(P)/FAD-binding protein YdhS [Nocardioides scoriae]
MRGGEGDCTVVVVGAGAAGTLTASHLVTGLSQRYRVVLVDPEETTGRGTAYRTTDPRHLLNVPASGMSAFVRDPEHFFRWVRRHHDASTQPQDFVPRHVYGSYVESLLETASEYPGNARLERRHQVVETVDRRGDRFVVRLRGGESVVARAVVLATGSRPGTDWAPEGLAGTTGLVADPWREPLPEGDLLLVGTGLTMVDVALSAAGSGREGRTLHAVSRHGELPRTHRLPTTPAVPPPPGITRVTTLDELSRVVADHVGATVAETGDWRAALDGLRPVTAQLWQGLCDEGKRGFLRQHARTWDVHRHRMPPVTAARLAELDGSGRLVHHTGTLEAARRTGGAWEVTLTGGEVLHVDAVVNCTGPVGSIASDPLLSRLARTGLVRPGPAGLGIDTADDGRVTGVLPGSMPFFALGALRRGNLWESTAMPEIREQTYAVAQGVVRALHGETRRRPTDTYGLTLTTGRAAARAYDDALGRLLRLQDGVEDGLRHAVELDPGFAQAHAALALLGHEWGAAGSWRRSLAAAHEAAADHHLDDREVSFLDAVTTRLRTDEPTGAAALLRHIRLFPRDALAVSVAVPTVAFGGLTSGRQTADLVEGLGKTYGDDWWYAGQLAFVRQDQERWSEAEALSAYALSVEPASGHAVHARAHVFYETGRHAEGLAWLDGWIRTCGRQAQHRSHFSWHAALHELVQGDLDAVHRRYERELAPPVVTGSRALVDSGSLLWRCHVTGTWSGPLPAEAVTAAAPDGWLITPPTAFAAMHAALGLAARGDAVGLAALRTTSLAHADATFRDVVAPLARALQLVVEGDLATAADHLEALLPRLTALGGSAAQREVVEDTLVHALAGSGATERAAAVLDGRLARRTSPLDARRLADLRTASPRP